MNEGIPGIVIRGIGSPFQLEGYDFKTVYELWQKALVDGELLTFMLGPDPIVVDPKEVIALVTLTPAPAPGGTQQLSEVLKRKRNTH
jgi:hypothetical protein